MIGTRAFLVGLALSCCAACSPAIIRYPGPLGSVGLDSSDYSLEHRGDPGQGEVQEQNAVSALRASASGLLGQRMARFALAFVDARRLVVNGQTFRFDCSGLIEAVYAKAGMELKGSSKEMYAMASQMGVLHRTTRPNLGDIAFFDNTYDRNKNGRLDDRLTHVALVVGVAPDGTVELVHKGGQGVKRIHMNLKHRDMRRSEAGQDWNDYLRTRRSGDPKRTKYLAGELWVGFGSLWQVLGSSV